METASYSKNNAKKLGISLVLPCDAVRDVKWKSTSSIGNIIFQTYVTKLHNRLLGALFMLFWLQEAGSYRKGVYCRALIESEWLKLCAAYPMNIPLHVFSSHFKSRLVLIKCDRLRPLSLLMDCCKTNDRITTCDSV